MLDYAFDFTNSETDYSLELCRDSDWKSSKHRVLIVLQTVPQISLRKKELATDYVRDTLTNCIKTARRMARDIADIPHFSFAVANFNNYPHLSLKGSARAEAEVSFTARINKMIRKLKPTHVFVSGDQAAAHLIGIPEVSRKRGWVTKKAGLRYSSTFDLDKAFGERFKNADVLGVWCRHLSHLLLGKHPFDLKDLVAVPKYAGTIKEFKVLMQKLESTDSKNLIAVDTETANLSANCNAIYTIQFCFDTDPTVGWVLPIQHPKTPFSSKEISYIHKRLGAWFDRRADLPTLVTFNGSFDLMVIRSEFRLPILYFPIWEIRAGEHNLDENIGSLHKVGPAMGNLAAIFASYGNDFYYTASFSKADRASSGLVEANDPNFLRYAATDVVSLLGIRKKQLQRAKIERLGNKSYLPWFRAHMHYIMGPTTHTISHLQADGSYVSREYLKAMLAPDSELRKEIKIQERKLRKLPEVIEANRRLLESYGLRAGSLWGDGNEQWVFKLSKPDHKRLLFFDILGLEPLSETKGGQPAIDKEFIEHYEARSKAVAILGSWSKRQKLLSTYGVGWLKRLDIDLDSRKDGHIRASYNFFNVVTGRLGSSDPNLQNIPSRGVLAKIIKAMFVAPRSKLLIRFDYSAHEVRMWAIAAVDKALANSFAAGLKLRQQLISAMDDQVVAAIKSDLKTKGDIHIQNVFRFFGKWVTKDDPLRYAIKAVVFGVLYGKGAPSLGRDVGPYATAKRELSALDKSLRAEKDPKARKAIKAKMKDLRRFIHSADEATQEQEDTRYAQSIIDKMFAEFRKGGQWTEKMKGLAESEHYAYSPFGRKRRMWSALTGIRSVIAAGVRQGSNAPIQGYASESGVRSSRDVALAYYTALPELAEELGYSTEPEALRRLWIEFNRIVHDALYHAVPYEMVLPFIHILQWHSTFGLAAALGKEFNLDFLVPPEIEIEIGAQDTRTYAWDWTMPGLARIIDKSVQDAQELGLLDRDPEEVMRCIWKPYQVASVRKTLQKRWPILNVRDLRKPIANMHQNYLKTIEDPDDRRRYKKIMKAISHDRSEHNAIR